MSDDAHPFAGKVLAALEPVAAPDYRLAPHLQRIVEASKIAPQWDTVNDRMAPQPARAITTEKPHE